MSTNHKWLIISVPQNLSFLHLKLAANITHFKNGLSNFFSNSN